MKEFDVIVVGSGAGGLTTATVAARLGLSVLVVESTAWFGGTTALSGGFAWIPCNHVMRAAGCDDSRAEAETSGEAARPIALQSRAEREFMKAMEARK